MIYVLIGLGIALLIGIGVAVYLYYLTEHSPSIAARGFDKENIKSVIYAVQPQFFKENYPRTLQRVLPIVLISVGLQCNYYRLGVYKPKSKVKLPSMWRRLPDDLEQKRHILENISTYILSSERPEEFLLWLDPSPISRIFLQKRIYAFDHHDDLESWVLNIDEAAYNRLKESLVAEHLSANLFLPVTNGNGG